MKFISLDIETLGLGLRAPVIEVGAVMCDGHILKPHFHCYVTHESYDECEPYAMSMHPKMLKRIATREDGYQYLTTEQVWPQFFQWVMKFQLEWPRDKWVIGGKNVAGFDMPRLEKQCGFKSKHYHYRFLDPGCMWLEKDDKVLPNLLTCMARSQSMNVQITHTAVEDAIDTAEVILSHFERLK